MDYHYHWHPGKYFIIKDRFLSMYVFYNIVFTHVFSEDLWILSFPHESFLTAYLKIAEKCWICSIFNLVHNKLYFFIILTVRNLVVPVFTHFCCVLNFNMPFLYEHISVIVNKYIPVILTLSCKLFSIWDDSGSFNDVNTVYSICCTAWPSQIPVLTISAIFWKISPKNCGVKWQTNRL